MFNYSLAAYIIDYLRYQTACLNKFRIIQSRSHMKNEKMRDANIE